MNILMSQYCSSFAENKDVARTLREAFVLPTFKKPNEHLILDFAGVDSSTQSFIHALISEAFQTYGNAALERIEFKNCSSAIKSLITTVVNYSME